MGDIRLSLIDAMGMDMLSGVLGVVLAAVGASVCGGSGLALVGAGPVGLIAGAAAGALLALVGCGEMEKLLGGMNVPVLLRQLVTDGAVKAGVDRQKESIERSIIAALSDPRSGFAAGLCDGLAGTLGTQLERMAQAAEMNIQA